MASTNIKSVSNGVVWYQTGNGIPDHIAIKGTTYLDLNTVDEYLNDDGLASWKLNSGSGPIGPDIYISGMTFDTSDYDLILNRNDGVVFTQNLGILASDMNVTGGTYNASTGTASFTNNSGGTFNVTGFLTGMTDTYVTGGTYSAGTTVFTNNAGDTFSVNGYNTGTTDSYTTGATLNGNIIQFDNNILGSNYYNIDLIPVLSGKTNVSLFNLHTGNTNNPHQTSFDNLFSTGHTHSISDVNGLQTILDTKFDKTGGTINGNVTANSFIKSGTTSTNALLAGGGTLVNPIGGSGGTNQISYWSSSSGQSGSSNFTWDGTNVSLGNVNGLIMSSAGVNRSIKMGGYTFVDNLAGASFYPSSGTNVGSTLTIIPKGNGYTSTIKSQVSILNTDLVADPNNYEHMSVRAGGASFVLSTGKVVTGVIRPLLLSAGYGDSATNPNQLWLYADGRIGINNAINNSVDQLQLNGSLIATTIKKSGGTSSQFLKADGSVDTNPAQIRLSASTNISTLTTDASGFGQNGRHVIIDNTTGITFTTSATSETNFVASYLKHGVSSVTFSAGTGTVLSALTGTAIMNGGAGSRATLSRVDNLFYLTIANV